MEIKDFLVSRRSTRFFDPSRRIDESTLRRILEQTLNAPSNFNLQPWRYILVTSPEGKRRLFETAARQQKVHDASAILIVCGDTTCWREAERMADDMVEKGYFPAEARQGYLNLVRARYKDAPQARDTVLRDVMMAATLVIAAAADEGVDATPLSGFDPAGLSNSFGIPDEVLPVLLIALGYARKADPPRARRKELADVLCVESWTLPVAGKKA